MTRRLLLVPVVMLVALAVATSAMAANSGSTISRSKHAGPYTLILKIGPAEKMGMGGEKMMGGKKARCSMAGMAMTAGHAMGMAQCNHHVELHVNKSGNVVHGAHVTIRMYCLRMHMNVWVPIMTMMRAMHPGDFHYGNNVHAPKGVYKVFVSVNGVHAKFGNVHVRA